MKLDRKIVAFGLLFGLVTFALNLMVDWLMNRSLAFGMNAIFASILAAVIIVIKTRQADKKSSTPDA